MNKLGTALEEEVAQYFRERGATKVAHDIEIMGNQIDVVATEQTPAGTMINTIVECKDLGKPVGVTPVNKFATIYRLLKQNNLADAAWIVSSQGFSRPARKAAEEVGITLLDIKDLRTRLKKLLSLDLATVLDSRNIVVIRPEGTFLAYNSLNSIHTELATTHEHLIEDPNNIKRVTLLADYITEIEHMSAEPTGSIATVDLSGDATAFSNWINNPLYIAILQANQHYAEAYRRRYGSKGIPVQRNFVIDPSQFSSARLKNLEEVLRLHLRFGLVAGIIYKDSNVPSEVLSDMGAMAERICFEYGRAEASDPRDVELLDIVVPKGDLQFKRIRERVAWANDPRNLDILVTSEEDICEVIQDIERRMKEKRS
jgi:Restriction endonuclease